MSKEKEITCSELWWAILWRQSQRAPEARTVPHDPFLESFEYLNKTVTRLFHTRKDAAGIIERLYGIRPAAEWHKLYPGWCLPRPVRVRVQIEVAEK